MDDNHAAQADHELRASLERVKTLLVTMRTSDTSDAAQSSEQLKNSVILKPCLKSDELTAWETTHQLQLPAAYQLFLLEIGNGFRMPGAYCDFEIRSLDYRRIDSRLREPFPITKKRLRQRIMQLRTVDKNDDALFPELSQYWDDDIPPGCLILGHYPSYDTVFLVVSGELYGTVWCAVDSGVPELDSQETPFDFLGWFEDTISTLNRTE